MPLPLQLCDLNHQAIAYLGDCPLCARGGTGDSLRQFSKQLSRVTQVSQLEDTLKETYGLDRQAV